ncbi:MAG: metallophosphoesterase family protein [Bacteroidales bacterium]|nr:metallophosphoesterase family protein [Bacteroidales bacterium]MBQ5541089.1 metallophosphoesterase family protein [Bacteroidales bacterium]
MKTIGLLSDTHNSLDDRFLNFFENCDEIWHAGDFGTLDLADRLSHFKPLRGVYGNIDDYKTRLVYPETQRFTVENVDVFMIHIGGYPGKYSVKAREVLKTNPPKIFVCGHSHILKVMYDEKYGCLVMNPGAAGWYGQQVKRTALKFIISESDIKDLEICELPR